MVGYSVGLPVRNEENTLEGCVRSVMEQTKTPEAVYICLNGSNKETRLLAADLARTYAPIRLLESAPGKCLAWERIVRESATNNILFTDGDVRLPATAAENLLAALEQNPRAAVANADIYFLPPTGGLLAPLVRRVSNKLYPVHCVTGQLYMMRRDELAATARQLHVPLFEPNTIHDDTTIAMVARAAGVLVKGNTFAYVQPVSTVRDYFHTALRGQKAREQLRQRYPDIYAKFERLSATDEGPRKRFPLPLRLAYTPVRAAIRAAARLSLRLGEGPTTSVWTEIKSTKQPFELHLDR